MDQRAPARFRLLTLLLIALLPGCSLLLPITTPIPAEREASTPRHDSLLLLLPGITDPVSKFREEGFIAEVHRQQLPVDVISVGTHLGYYSRRQLVRRLAEDLIQPARAAGYRQVWLAGISLGGFGALEYAIARPGEVDGILLIAPFLGGRGPLNALFLKGGDRGPEIRRAGGLRRWHAALDAPPQTSDRQLALWQWLGEYAAHADGEPPIYLAYGRGDYLASWHELLDQALPRARVVRTDGDHSWVTWKRLWPELLRRARAQIAPDAPPPARQASCLPACAAAPR